MTTVALTNAGEELFGLVLTGQAPTLPGATMGIALCSAYTPESNSFTELAQANGYDRIAIGATEFDTAASGGSISNDGAAIEATASGSDWAAITHIVFVNSQTHGAGTALAYHTVSKTIADGETFRFVVGELTLTASGNVSNTFRNFMCNVLAGRNPTAIAATYLGLLEALSDIQTASFTEQNDAANGYARIACDGTYFPATATDGVLTSDADIEFADATDDWGNSTTHVALFDAASSGNILAAGAASPNLDIEDGDTPTIPSGDLVITLT